MATTAAVESKKPFPNLDHFSCFPIKKRLKILKKMFESFFLLQNGKKSASLWLLQSFIYIKGIRISWLHHHFLVLSVFFRHLWCISIFPHLFFHHIPPSLFSNLKFVERENFLLLAFAFFTEVAGNSMDSGKHKTFLLFQFVLDVRKKHSETIKHVYNGTQN